MKKTYYIAWNKSRTEGFITDDEMQAEHAAGRYQCNPCSTVADAFHEAYLGDYDDFDEDDDREELEVQRVALDARGEG